VLLLSVALAEKFFAISTQRGDHMARNQGQGQVAAEQIQFEAPEGFQRSGSANAVGWFNMGKIGNTLHGVLIGMFERKDKLRADTGKSNFFQVKISQECEVRIERGEDATMVMAKPGDVVNINYGPKTKPWETLIGDIKRGAEYEVLGCIIGAKAKLDGGRTMHNFDVYQKMMRAPQVDAEPGLEFGDGAGEVA
jgi:hypothetical protein